MLDSLPSQRLIFVTGKGGVGKSTTCAALGQSFAERGERTLIVETDTYSAMAELFDTALKDSQIAAAKGVEHLELVNLSAQDALIQAIRQFVPSDRVARGVIQNRVANLFFKAAPSVNEFSILNMVRHYLDERQGKKARYDHVIVDLPASGHAVTFLNVPKTLYGMIRVGRLAQICLELSELIADERRCALMAVCLPEEMPVNETIELAGSIQNALNRHLSCVMLNMVHPQPFSSSHRALFEAVKERLPAHRLNEVERLSAPQRVVSGASLAMQWHDRDVKYTRLLRSKLHEHIALLELPMLYERRGRDVISKLAAVLQGVDPERSDRAAG